MIRKIINIAAITLIICFFLIRFSSIFQIIVTTGYYKWWYGSRGRVNLLCKSNYEVLLEDCRELLEIVESGKLKSGKYNLRIKPDPNISIFPKSLIDLHPTYIYIDEDYNSYVMVEMLGGLEHFGITAYKKDFLQPFQDFHYGDKELISGLWYYDDNYSNNPGYDKIIDNKIKKNKYLKK